MQRTVCRNTGSRLFEVPHLPAGVVAAALFLACVGSAHSTDSAPGSDTPAREAKKARPEKVAAAAWCETWFFATLPEDRHSRDPEYPPPGAGAKWTVRSPGGPLKGVRVSVPGAVRTFLAVLPEDPPSGEEGSAYEVGAEVGYEEPMHSFANARGPVLQIRLLPSGDPGAPERWLKKLVAAKTGITDATETHRRRRTRVLGRNATELCVSYRFSPGHMTPIGGGHIPLPFEHDLVAAYFVPLRRKVLAVSYRIPELSVASWRPIFERIVASIDVD